MKRLLLLIMLLPLPVLAVTLAIKSVQTNQRQFDPARKEELKVRFELTEPASAELKIYDGRELLIRTIAGDGVLKAGEHALLWDGRDAAGRFVPSEAYLYTLEARSNTGDLVRFDLADVTGGAEGFARDAKWDPDAGTVSYFLDKPGRVSIRIGLNNNGPLLRTLLDWVPRPAGQHREVWDGWDNSHVLDLRRHPDLAIGVIAFNLPDNTVFLGEPPRQSAVVEDVSWGRTVRPVAKAPKKRMFSHSQQPMESRGDYDVQLRLPEGLARSSENLPLIVGNALVPVQLLVADSQRVRALNTRFEPVFFVDGQFVFENEVGFMPMTWNLNPTGLSEGEHFLTVNLRGYEGNFGMATTKILITRRPVSPPSEDAVP